MHPFLCLVLSLLLWGMGLAPVLADTAPPLSLTLSAPPVQPWSNGGIRVQITMTNQTEERQVLRSPLDTLSVSLRRDGKSMELPFDDPRALRDAEGDDGRLRPPYRIRRITLAGKTLSDPEIQQSEFVLPAHARMIVEILVDRIREVDRPSAPGTGFAQPPSGDYDIGALLNLSLQTGRATDNVRLASDVERVHVLDAQGRSVRLETPAPPKWDSSSSFLTLDEWVKANPSVREYMEQQAERLDIYYTLEEARPPLVTRRGDTFDERLPKQECRTVAELRDYLKKCLPSGTGIEWDAKRRVLHLMSQGSRSDSLLDRRFTLDYSGALEQFPGKISELTQDQLRSSNRWEYVVIGNGMVIHTPRTAPIHVQAKRETLREILTEAVPPCLWKSRCLWATMTEIQNGQRVIWLDSYTEAFQTEPESK